MKAAQVSQFGENSLKIVDIEQPKPGPDQVLVKVAAAAVNPFDYKVLDGIANSTFKINVPATLGGDVSGTVAELGENVSGFTIGQAVYGEAGAASGHGSFAEFTPVKAVQLSPKPNNIDYLTAAALPLVATSAYQAIVDHLNLQASQKILIHGGAGGIGSMAVQIAKAIGAYVATTVAGKDVDYAKELGADEVIDYEKQDFSQLLKDFDAVFDTVGGETNAKSYAVLKNGAGFVSMVAPPDDGKVADQHINYTAQGTKFTPERFAKITELVEAGKLKVNIDKTFPLEQANEALQYLKTGHPRGKVVIKIK